MAPRRKRITRLGQHLRAVRQALSLDQRTLAAMVQVSARTLSRWENGVAPTPAQAMNLLDAADNVPAELYNSLAEVLGIELEPPDAPAVEALPLAPAVAAPAPALAPLEPPPALAVAAEPPRVEPPRPTDAELRATLDAVVYAAAEARDIPPRHLRTFAVEILQASDRLGLGAKEAAHLVAVAERTNAKRIDMETRAADDANVVA
jgi:transcriptional regulator with XRE-family HTH domain